MMNSVTRRSFLGASAAAALSLAACGGETGADVSTAATASDEARVSVMLGSNVISLDTNLATDGDSFEVIADCIDGLMQLDAGGTPIPALAERYEVSDDECAYVFHLRDATWSNGDAVKADDFVFAWRRICALAGEYAYMMDEIARIKGAAAIIAGKESDATTLAVTATDERTLSVELEVPVPYFLSLMCFPTFYPINQAFFEGLDDGVYGTSPETFLSCGAFVLDSYTPGTASLTLTKNATYWDADRVSLAGTQLSGFIGG